MILSQDFNGETEAVLNAQDGCRISTSLVDGSTRPKRERDYEIFLFKLDFYPAPGFGDALLGVLTLHLLLEGKQSL
ncbi:hypothetical protein [Staphylococcus marylandisciuri]|uniref:hypothetical protein n=1 Tax=Staphylococcus marylandisciuri TaxID=2981529 RepID=UPI0021D38744|nr:hypothetical protein [Staphylococcus marylandisciuri]